MIHVAIVENETQQLRELHDFVCRYSEESGVLVAVHCFSDGEDLIEEFTPGRFEVILLDIKMEHMDGLATARLIREHDRAAVIMFITNMVNCAVEGYSVNAHDFIIKPVGYSVFADRLASAFEKALRSMKSTVRIKTLDGIACLDRSEITYVEVVSRRTVIHTKSTTHTCYEALAGIEAFLADSRYFRCHSAFLVNLEYVRIVGRNSAFVTDKEIPVSRHRRTEFLDALTKYLSNVI